ncbi:hypothetical protein CC77DRAFT_786316 [Alternaria alternata]|jgi:hypothetical protein|uniref:F-box domain-containing protein n=2 Tax=Alternaria alternata complex TaxID=187734 RepID=A0A177DT09_ALTAL|nr:hypothetical protein CC77DRAFT_786316 [Alternaria alternata]XP_051587448.1 uncharacterized protein J4E82_006613 [Alternaria postmessia]RYN49374.1 hypothetical protein AA0114_g6606 [Alternaria tenuissima]KAH6839043.1 hypothetical protein B0T12DRAFT_365911 [Alternaria alternata]KAI5374745.1 hypothetical protein J4E82_006613 [Alternaria postmessia]OAG22122.1 hypothetical protein CC77DRAFT_786316 [Alternaria alternata]OWY48529.1 hypothetical protein AALT_g7324 [Alternaria alternata]
MMDLQHQSHFSAFTRFSDMLKDTTNRRKQSASGHSIRNPSITALPVDADASSMRSWDSEMSRDSRRSSIGNYADRVRQMFDRTSTTHHGNGQRKGMTDLPAEVLQTIFIHLDFWDLLRAKRVCNVWRQLIPGDSPLLAEMLYLKPSRGLQIYNMVPTTFDLELEITPQSIEDGFQPSGTRFSVGVRNEISLMRRCLGLIRTSQEIVFHPVVMDFNVWIKNEKVMGAKEGSWRDMLVSMPPLRELTLRHGRKRNVVKVLTAGEDEDGVRLGALFDVMDEWMRRMI